MLPDAKGYTSMIRYLIGDTDEERRQMRDEILGTQAVDFQNFAQVIEKIKEDGIVKVLGSPDAIRTVADERPGWLDVIKVL